MGGKGRFWEGKYIYIYIVIILPNSREIYDVESPGKRSNGRCPDCEESWQPVFLDASTHLYRRVCLSVYPSVHQSVTRFFQTEEFEWKRHRNHRITI